MKISVLACLIPCLLAVTVLPAQTPQNAIVVIIDGMRHDDGWAQGGTYMPRLWNDLRPQGTYHARFWDRGWTATTGGHTTILSGVYQILRNNGSNEQDVRSFDPLAYEYYRRYFNAPESTCGVVVGKWGNVGAVCDYSLEPAYGEPWQGFQLGDGTTHDDTLSTRLLRRAMDSLHPRLMLLNMGDVDSKGHTGIYADYLQAIRAADSLIDDIWRHIQAVPPYTDTFYRNRTVLIVTSDHGRNDDAHGSFPAHGEWDHGSRQLGLLAIGAGIASGRTITTVAREQIDILPTVAAMLGFPVPLAEGEVMTELFASGYSPKPVGPPSGGPVLLALNISNTAGFSRDPDICRDRAGNLYCVWSDNTPGNWSVSFRKSSDNGAAWSAAQTLFNYPESDSVMWYARVAADDSLAVAAMGWGKHRNYIDSLPPSRMDTTYIWYPRLATSIDGGASWRYAALLDSSMGSYYAPVTVKNGRYGVAWWAVGQFTWQAPRNGIFFNNRAPSGAWRALPVEPAGNQCIHLGMADDGVNYHIAAAAWSGQDYDLSYHRSTDGGTTWSTTWVVQDPAGAPNYDYDPELVVDDSGMVHMFWARKQNSGGTWRIMYGRRNPGTGVFDTTQLVTSSVGAWQPHAARKGDTLALVWIDYRDGNPELYYRYSVNRGLNWSAGERLTYTDALTHHPRVSATSCGFYVVWQDLQSGNWEVYGRELDAGTGRDAGIVGINAPTGSVDSLAAVTPRVTFQNLGPLTATFKAAFSIRDLPGTEVYRDSTFVVDLAPGATVTQAFPAWPRPHPLGDYTTRCSLAFAGDQNPGNDLAAGVFAIVLPTPGWLERTSMPTPPSGKTLKDGAWLTYDLSAARVFGAKGYKTDDFYAYDPEADAWQELALIPRGIENRGPYKGAVGCATGQGVVYATRGNNTPGFLRYDASANKWQELPGVPLGPSNRKVKGGTDMAFVEKSGVGYVYLLKGYGNEFYRYNTYADSWQAMANAPTGINQKWDKGSFLVYDGNHTLYAHKAKYHELWSYNTLGDTWSSVPLTAMPFINRQGKSRKSKDGGCATWLGGAMYAFKGANTQELWKYYPQGDSWQEQDTIPSRGSSLRKKRVKAGADLTAYGGYVLLAFKGNRCNELWRYIPTTAALRDGISARWSSDTRHSEFVISPNPLRAGFATLRWDMTELGSANSDRVPRLSIYDVTGRLVLNSSLVTRNSSHSLDLRSLSAGVYLVRLQAGGFMATQKLLIQQ